MTERAYLIESQDPRLGRHVQHDERSKAFQVVAADAAADVLHRRVTPILDQGQLGSCTGNAAAGLLGTDPRYNRNVTITTFTEDVAVKLYSLATTLDSSPGQYPPDDTGSSGLAVAKAAKQLGYCTTYRHAFGFDQFSKGLTLRPCIVGVPWYDSMFNPDANGLVTISPDAQVAGGHEFVCRGLDFTAKQVLADNSWGAGWGNHGSFLISFDDMSRLLNENGDATFFH